MRTRKRPWIDKECRLAPKTSCELNINLQEIKTVHVAANNYNFGKLLETNRTCFYCRYFFCQRFELADSHLMCERLPQTHVVHYQLLVRGHNRAFFE